MRGKVFAALFTGLSLALAAPTLAQEMSLTRSVIGAGGGFGSDADYGLHATLAQPVVGVTASDDFMHSLGFWHGLLEPTAVDETPTLPTRFELGQNHPNPFNPRTSIRYALPRTSRVVLRLIDVSGREISVLLDAQQGAGRHEFELDARGLASGVYFYRLEAEGFQQTRKLVLLK